MMLRRYRNSSTTEIKPQEKPVADTSKEEKKKTTKAKTTK